MLLLKRVICVASIGFMLQACAGSKGTSTATTTSNPAAPKESYTNNGKQVEKYLSTIGIPFEITVADVERQINANIKDLVFEDNSMDDNNSDNFMCKVWKRDNIVVTPQEDAFTFNVPLKIWTRVGYKVMGMSIPPQELQFDLNVKFGTRFALTSDWQANVQSFPIGYEWVKKPTVRLAGIEISVAGLVERALNSKQDAILKALDDAVKKNIDIKKYVLQAWNTAMQPYMLSDKYRTWLKVTPVELQMTPLTTINNRIKSSIVIKAYTETVTGAKPVVNLATTIPDLKIVQSVPDDFKVGIIAEIPHNEAAKLTADTLIGQNFSFKDGKYNVQVTDIDIYGQADKMVIKAGLKGSINGNVYFKGVPTYNPTTKSIYLENFDYDLDTRNLLLRTANWMFQGVFAKNMQQALTFNIAGQVDEMKKQVQANLNKTVSKGVAMSGNLTDLSPDRVYMTPNSIIAVINASGKLNVKVDGL